LYLREHWLYLTRTGSYPGIDAMRALAVSAVILFHFKWLPFGWIGVDLFFVISGFLIGGIIIDKVNAGQFSMIEFYRNRALRILPIYYTAIALCYLFKASSTKLDSVALNSIATAALFLQTSGPYFFPTQFVVDPSYIPGGSWSLVVEETFYIFSPVLLIFLLAIFPKILDVAKILVIIALAAIPIRLYMTKDFAYDDSNWHFANFIQFHSRYDELLAGIICAILVRSIPELRRWSQGFVVASAVLASIFLAFIVSHPIYLKNPQMLTRDTVWLPTLLGAVCAVSVLGFYWMPVKTKVIIALARLSYPLYLMHILLEEVVKQASSLMELASKYMGINAINLIIMVLSIILSWLLSLTIEYPFIRIYKSYLKN
jgi:peptidoglycan/LPS O-acetylase OafA/YrhL